VLVADLERSAQGGWGDPFGAAVVQWLAFGPMMMRLTLPSQAIMRARAAEIRVPKPVRAAP
jgi:hypothetical protein